MKYLKQDTHRYKLLFGLLIFTLFLIIEGANPVGAATIQISKRKVTLEKGESKKLTISGTKKKVTWKSSKKSVATVTKKGKVTAKSVGTATITATVAGKKLTCKINVVKPIKLNKTNLSLTTGDTVKLKVKGTDENVTWSSNKKAVAKVSKKGKVTAKSEGTATITATVAGKKLISKVTVKSAIPTPIPSSTKTESSYTPPTPVLELTNPRTKVVGYYAAWSRYSGFTPSNIDANKLTHINYAFANIGSDYRVSLGYPDIDEKNIQELNQLKEINPQLKTLIAVGGWSWSGRFSDMASSEESRMIFAESVVDFITKYDFDGVDIDWEYPVSGGLATNTKRPEDKQNFTLLLKTLRQKLDEQSRNDGKHYILSFAGAAGSWYVNNIETEVIRQYVDYANIMTYDIHGTWDLYTDFNAPLYTSNTPSHGMKWSVDSSIKAWVNAGFPREKLIMGVPFYGYIYKAVGDENHGLGQTYSGGSSINYANIAANYLNDPSFTRYFHSESLVPWLFNGSTFLSYEDEQSMTYKAQYVKQNSLGGAMIWELSQDPNRVLLNALYHGLK
ncbi:MAG: glycoside hydrolase family 18 [Clostridiales bacterium]|jgi:chitinase|nr:glycoside hydrolase family 18 [Clostridiales bacterium]